MWKLLSKILKALSKALRRLARRMRGLLGLPEPVSEFEEVEVADVAAEAAVEEAKPSRREPSLAELVADAARAKLAGRAWRDTLILHPFEKSWLDGLSRTDLAIVSELPPDSLAAHLAGTDVVAGLPPVDRSMPSVPFSSPEPAPDPELPDMPKGYWEDVRKGGGRRKPQPTNPAMLSAAEAYDLACMLQLEAEFAPGYRPR